MKSLSKKERRERRLGSIEDMIRMHKEHAAARLKKTRKIFGRKIYTADLHSHSTYTDGLSTVDENCEWAKMAGIDLLFATDHSTIKARRVVKKHANASWGEESGAGGAHIGLLEGEKVFDPAGMDLATAYEGCRAQAKFAWIAHPAGCASSLFSATVEQTVDLLSPIRIDFAMEVLNGFCHASRAYKKTDANTVKAWDVLLSRGRRITPIGASDAHYMIEIGHSWTGVFAASRSSGAILKALVAGNCFASEASLIDFSCNGKLMGSELSRKRGSELKFQFKVADHVGLALVQVVSQGKVIKEFQPDGAKCCEGSFTRKVGGPAYYRIQSVAMDDLRAFSAPVYVRPRR